MDEKKKKIIEVVVASIVFLILAFFIFDQIMRVVVHYKKIVIVPQLVGKSVDQALGLLSNVELGIKKTGEQYDKKFPPNSIFFQNPAAGTRVREGKIVRVIISRGGESVFIPDLYRQSIRSAELLLRREGLGLGETSKETSLCLEKGMVIDQDPTAGLPAEKETMINLTVSSGAPEEGNMPMPNFVNQDINVAQKWARKQGLNVINIVEEKQTVLQKGTIIRHEPAADEKVGPATELKFIVSALYP